jgi:hypothetical protein
VRGVPDHQPGTRLAFGPRLEGDAVADPRPTRAGEQPPRGPQPGAPHLRSASTSTVRAGGGPAGAGAPASGSWASTSQADGPARSPMPPGWHCPDTGHCSPRLPPARPARGHPRPGPAWVPAPRPTPSPAGAQSRPTPPPASHRAPLCPPPLVAPLPPPWPHRMPAPTAQQGRDHRILAGTLGQHGAIDPQGQPATLGPPQVRQRGGHPLGHLSIGSWQAQGSPPGLRGGRDPYHARKPMCLLPCLPVYLPLSALLWGLVLSRSVRP